MGMVFGRVSEETPAFELIKQATAFQVRAFVPGVAAECQYSADAMGSSAGQSDAFRKLAKYIGVFGSPENRNAGGAAEPIAMTAPVFMVPPDASAAGAPAAGVGLNTSLDAPLTGGGAKHAGGPRTMAFLLPAKYSTVEAAPIPADSAVSLRVIPGRTQAVSTFTWSLDQANIATHLDALGKPARNPPLPVMLGILF
jgi:hypothetical protein